jgi:hypothetical protein
LLYSAFIITRFESSFCLSVCIQAIVHVTLVAKLNAGGKVGRENMEVFNVRFFRHNVSG